MRSIYNIFMHLSVFFIKAAAFFSPKMSKFLQGRKNVFSQVSSQISSDTRILWMHCASLGEYEQGLPVLRELRKKYPSHKIVLTFFSSSGYEVKKKTAEADVVSYLPLDTIKNARKWVEMLQPALVLFVKYEIWPNYLLELKARNIPVLLISGLFRPQQIYFRSTGGWMRSILKTISHFFVQGESSKKLLEEIGIKEVTVSGDTRFDRVVQQVEADNRLDFLENFIAGKQCVVIGSSWPEDEDIFVDYINQSAPTIKFIIAPHQINEEKILALEKKITAKTVRFSRIKNEKLADYRVLIIDAIGFLSKVYSYADWAYVGGGMGTAGLHNILEPATFGIPVIIGKNFRKFPEAVALKTLGGLFSVRDKTELSHAMNRLQASLELRRKAGEICKNYVLENRGATEKIIRYIQKGIFPD